MSGNDYQVIFKGELAGDIPRDQVQAKLASLFKMPVQNLDNLFNGTPSILKKGASQIDCRRMQEVLLNAGAVSYVNGPDGMQPPPGQARRDAESNGRNGKANGQGGPNNGAVPGNDQGHTAAGRNRYSLSDFVKTSAQKDRGEGTFELEGDRMLEINLGGDMWIKMGSMVAYRGNITFSREGLMSGGMGKLLKRSLTGEGTRLTMAEGHGVLYCADMGKKITILELDNEAIIVNGNDVLAFETSIGWDITVMKKVSAMMAGGLFNMRLEGKGMVAITTHHDPMALMVDEANPVYTDPNATVAWSESLIPEFKADVTLRTLFGRGSGDSLQMAFKGRGFVVVQPYEESYGQAK